MLMLRYSQIFMEYYENYQKQTFRNRCSIYGANGKMDLIIPVQHTGKKMIMKDIRISYNHNWQKLHWRSLEAAYRSSPYFEYFEDDFEPFYRKKYKYLLEFNETLQEAILNLLQLDVSISYTKSYKYGTELSKIADHRISSKPGRSVKTFYENVKSGQGLKRYKQVFDDRHGFIPNLSIVDLLFNMGQDSGEYLNF